MAWQEAVGSMAKWGAHPVVSGGVDLWAFRMSFHTSRVISTPGGFRVWLVLIALTLRDLVLSNRGSGIRGNVVVDIVMFVKSFVIKKCWMRTCRVPVSRFVAGGHWDQGLLRRDFCCRPLLQRLIPKTFKESASGLAVDHRCRPCRSWPIFWFCPLRRKFEANRPTFSSEMSFGGSRGCWKRFSAQISIYFHKFQIFKEFFEKSSSDENRGFWRNPMYKVDQKFFDVRMFRRRRFRPLCYNEQLWVVYYIIYSNYFSLKS
jgi:hypothetical protein